MDSLRKEQRIMVVMRKVLSNIIKDTTPSQRGMQHPLTENTIQDIRDAFSLISSRENEIAKELGLDESRPRFTDEVTTDKVVPISSISRTPKPNDED